MSVHKAEKDFFVLLKEGKSKVEALPSLDELREITKSLFEKYSGPLQDIPSKDLYITVRDGGKVRARVFNPDFDGPTIFFLPGNAFLFDLFEGNAVAASRIAKYSNSRVVIIDHRLMPEKPWPTVIDDSDDVITALCQNKDICQLNPEAIYLSGICSGAHAAALLALRKNKAFRIRKLILLNGLYDQSLSQKDYSVFEQEDGMIVRSACLWWFDHYGVSPEAAKEANRSPLYAEDFSEFPDTVLMIGEYDGFRSDSEAFYLKLQEHKVSVSKIILPGQTHNTMILRGAMVDGVDPAEMIAKAVLEE